MGHYVGVSELLINMKTRCKVCAKDFLQRSSGGLGKKKINAKIHSSFTGTVDTEPHLVLPQTPSVYTPQFSS